jgi:hypothetical protein
MTRHPTHDTLSATLDSLLAHAWRYRQTGLERDARIADIYEKYVMDVTRELLAHHQTRQETHDT